ncbi:hypothetical protein CBR_g26413 [Chara braunii]|uniref:Thioredoxin domain-containing protein n=1 Tax=Chara braunii TaxID=69332 RepID=A0A388L7U9_CHABU|nr:hypothetical protein CBR_g26413 [Chara braunii]|eukprot:GBG78385.1 hypothetical protein CBR_g26413 [Chara braunii]
MTTWIGTSLSTPSGLLSAESKEPKGVRHVIATSASSSKSCSSKALFGPREEIASLVHSRSARLPGAIGTATPPLGCRRGVVHWRAAVSVRENSLATEQSGGMTGMTKEGAKKSKKDMKQIKEEKKETEEEEDKIIHVHTRQELEEALRGAGSKLAVVEYTAKEDRKRVGDEEEEEEKEKVVKIYPSIVQLSKSMKDVVFITVETDKSEESKEMHRQEKIDKLPHFAFYKNMEVVHREEGIDAEQLVGDVLYYGDNDAPIYQIRSREDAESFLAEHANDHKLVVVDVSLKECNPCVRVYPTVVNLSRRMSDFAVFARMFGDENAACSQMLKEMGVRQVPTFLFIRDGKLCGRYVGSGKGELIGEILRYQGVKVT